jgi:hypothetical protein
MYPLIKVLKVFYNGFPSSDPVSVLNDVVKTMLNTEFVEELFKPQDLYVLSRII